MTTRLHVKEIVSYGFVDEGDNPAADVAVVKAAVPYWKRDFSVERRKELAERGLALPDGSFPIVTVADLKNAVKAAGRATDQAKAQAHIKERAEDLGRTDLLPDTWTTKTAQPDPPAPKITDSRPDRARDNTEKNRMSHDLTGLPDEIQVAVKADLERLAEFEKAAPTPDPIEKADPAVQAEIKKVREEAERLKKELDAERDARLTAKYIAVAKGHPGFADDEDPKFVTAGEMLKRVAATDQEALDWLLTKVEALEKISKESDLFREVGSRDGGDATAKIEALAKDLQKQDPNLSDAQARLLARKQRPDLREAERQENI